MGLKVSRVLLLRGIRIVKKIIFDLMVCQPVEGAVFHGGGEYTKTVFKKLVEDYSSSVDITAFYNPDLFMDQWVLKLIEENRIRTLKVRNYNEVSNLLEFKYANTFVACLMEGVEKVVIPDGMKIIGVYHGFRDLEKPIDRYSLLFAENAHITIKYLIKMLARPIYRKYKYNEMKRKIFSCTDIVGVSYHSGYSARVFFPEFNEKHIHVYYSPVKYIEPSKKNCTADHASPFILMLGGDRWVKNLYRGLVAIDQLFSSDQLNDYSVKIVGGIPKRIKRKLKNKDRFIPVDYLESNELEALYDTCELLFYPTLNEGFGYPPEEAMKYGKTCVISAVNSLPEIYGDSAYYCNPYDINEMKTRLIQASQSRIPIQTIKTRYEVLTNKQASDLDSFCKLIVS